MNRRNFIGKVTALGLTSSIIRPFHIIKRSNLDDEVIGHGDFRYRVERDWVQFSANKAPVINCHEMVMTRNKQLIMVTDHPKNNVIIMDKSGKLLDTWTLGFNSAHGLTLVEEGEEELLLITDPNSGSVVKTTLKGEILMRIDPYEEGVYEACQVFRPTETCVAQNGDIYVADGYGSQFITQYDDKGKAIRKFGGDSFLQKEKFKQVHGIAIDNRDSANPKLICTARIKNAFKWFALDGEYLEEVYLPGAFISRPVMNGDNIYSGVCFGMLPNKPYITQELGFVTILDKENKVVSNPGGKAPEYVDGALQVMYQDRPVFRHCHDVCVDDDENLYVLQWNAGGVYPYKLHRI